MTLASSLHDYAAEIGHWWQIQREKYRDIEALRAMSPREIEELGGELGLSRLQFEAIVKAGPEAADEMIEMMAALGVDPAAVQAAYPALTRDMKVTCATCGDKRTCRHSLEDGTAPALMPTFCPNADEMIAFAKRAELRAD